MATIASAKRSERRRRQKSWERWIRQPEVVALRREILRRHRYRERHPFAGLTAMRGSPLWLYCFMAGMHEGGRPPRAKRCTKRLGTRLCWGWRESDSDRCYQHRRLTRGKDASDKS
jgi:hypothetical protein